MTRGMVASIPGFIMETLPQAGEYVLALSLWVIAQHLQITHITFILLSVQLLRKVDGPKVSILPFIETVLNLGFICQCVSLAGNLTHSSEHESECGEGYRIEIHME
jgi:hypothetical protein